MPDSLAISTELKCGAMATLHFSCLASFAGGERMEIFGSDGSLFYKFFGDEISGARRGDKCH